MSNESMSLCDEVADDLARVVDGTAPQDLFDHIEGCDVCRDLRHDASRAASLIGAAGADFAPSPELLERTLAALDARSASASASASAPAADEKGEESGPRAKTEIETPGRLPDAQWAALKGEASSAPASASAADEKAVATLPVAGGRRGRVLGGVAAAVLAAAAATALYVSRDGTTGLGVMSRVQSAGAWAGKVTSVVRAGEQQLGGIEVCDSAGSSCAPLSLGQRVEAGKLVRTDARTRVELRLDDDTSLLLDRSAELVLRDDQPRSAKLVRGEVTADVSHIDGANARLAIPGGSIEVLGTKFSVQGEADRARVEVARGVVLLRGSDGSSEHVRAGEEGRITPGRPVSVASSMVIGEGLAWTSPLLQQGKTRVADEPAEEPLRGLGELRARKPGQQEEREGAVRLARHDVKVRIAGNVARTEIDETFENQTGDELEGIFRFPLPADAQIERLALEVDGKLEEGAFVEKERAAAIWRGVIQNAAPKTPKPTDEIIWVPGPWRDPALLEWKRGGRFELRIFPIPARKSRRVVLAYTQTVQPVGGVRRYTYPLPYDVKGSTRVASFYLDARVTGHDTAQGVKPSGYQLARSVVDGAAERVEMREQNFTPAGDLVLEYAVPSASSELEAWGYQMPDARGDDEAAYVALALRPKLPRARERQVHEHVLVVDRSRSMVGERLARAKAVAVAMAREADDQDRISVLACDTTCERMPEGSMAPGARAAEAVERFLGGMQADGASDVVEMLRIAQQGAEPSGGRLRNIVYIGDGAVSAGVAKPDRVTSAVRYVLGENSSQQVMAIAVGADADSSVLSAMARGGRGVVIPYVPGEQASKVALSALSASYGSLLHSVELQLPAGLEAVAPSQLDSIRAGSETVVVARMRGAQLEGEVVLRGKVGQEPFEQRYPLVVQASRDAGNAFVPRLYAASRIADLERAGGDDAKKAIVELSKRFSIASRHTSLLVLESEAMFSAFGLKRSDPTYRWTGESAASSTRAKGAMPVDEEAELEAKQGMSADAYGEEPMPAATAAAARGGFAMPPAPAAPMKKAESSAAPRGLMAFDRPMVPMRRVWDRKGSFSTDVVGYHERAGAKIIAAEGAIVANPDSPSATRELFALYAQHGRIDKATELAERWASRDALDPAALVARADMAARRGQRTLAVRLLGSVVDVRPDDAAAQGRLANLLELSGQPARACAHRIALAEQTPQNIAAQSAAARCARATSFADIADRIVADVPADKRAQLERPEPAAVAPQGQLRGDVQLEASWDGDVDLDVALIDKNGQRLGWMGGGKGAITARDVVSSSGEGLGFVQLGAGNYVIEVTRSDAQAGVMPVTGSITVRVQGEMRKIPFVLNGDRVEVGRVEIQFQSRLVPAW